ncbi:hypothetical protein [Mycobacterium sherrisii]|uniref:hypothetical protein n=1 Tax=Mycobacterium sherrisii TaxID=243061 RepID=UPI0018DCD507|nr:hypothetical protein [Mycobacterium sherrisii]MCV7031997.1 hypothetical protein [Mycobacterium sherrisii]MEC4763994.1 hypothetical protein [Mycobacterium sherrisii]
MSTFVTIGQNRQAVFQQARADHDLPAREPKTNTALSHLLTEELHRRLLSAAIKDRG